MNGAVITIRTSGTEPKIKYYSEFIGSEHEATKKVLEELVESFVEDILRPEFYGFERRIDWMNKLLIVIIDPIFIVPKSNNQGNAK